MSEWIFTGGTKIKATKYVDALAKMSTCDFTHHWAMEEEPGRWVVLFGSDIEVDVKYAADSFDAARQAILQVRSKKDLVEVRPYPKKVESHRRCCFLQRMCEPD